MEDREGDMKVDKTTEQGIGPYRRPAAAPDLAAPGGGGLIAEVYERFPYGIIVVDTGGGVVNPHRRGGEPPGPGVPARGGTPNRWRLLCWPRPAHPLPPRRLTR